MSANILIVGCGAIGGLFAAALSSVAKVTALDANAEHVNTVRSRGLRVIGTNPRVAQIEATSDPSALNGRTFDAVIFLIKSKMTAAALSQLKPVLPGNPLLATLQNGMGNAEVLLSDLDATVVRGVTMNAGRYVEAEGFGAYPPKTVKIDFNYAYNPNCARSAFFTCPVALDNLAMDISVGEKDPHKAH